MDEALPTGITGLTLHKAAFYDFTVWLMTLGQEKRFRDMVLDLAQLKPSETILDAGCGTGTLAIAAKRRVGPSGMVHGIDASPQMLARARHKAERAKATVEFQLAGVQALPYSDGLFDAVLSTVMLHHLPRSARQLFADEIGRVLKPGGRALLVDFAPPASKGARAGFHLHCHGHIRPEDIAALVETAGLETIQSGAVGFRNMHYVLGTKRAAGTMRQ